MFQNTKLWSKDKVSEESILIISRCMRSSRVSLTLGDGAYRKVERSMASGDF
jgi:hypothetical protein